MYGMPSSTWSEAVQLNELQRNCAKIEIEVEFELNCRKCPKKNQRNQCKRFEDEIAENGIGNWSWVQIHSSTQHKMAGYEKNEGMRKGIEPKGFCPNWFSDELPQLWKIN